LQLDLPSPGALPRAIRTFSQLADDVASADHETLGLLLVHIGVDVSVKERIADINRAQVQIECSCKCQNNSDGRQFRSRCESLEIVDTRPLRETFGNKAGFVPFDGTISVVLDFEHPTGANGLDARRAFDQLPGAVELVSSHFLSKGINTSLGILARHSLAK